MDKLSKRAIIYITIIICIISSCNYKKSSNTSSTNNEIDSTLIADSLKHIKFKVDSAKYLSMVEYVCTKKPRCNAFQEIWAFKISVKDTTGVDLKGLSEFLLSHINSSDTDCNFPINYSVFIYKNVQDFKKREGCWIVMNSYQNGFEYADYNNK